MYLSVYRSWNFVRHQLLRECDSVEVEGVSTQYFGDFQLEGMKEQEDTYTPHERDLRYYIYFWGFCVYNHTYVYM